MSWFKNSSSLMPIRRKENLRPAMRRNLFDLMDDYLQDWELLPRSLANLPSFSNVPATLVPAVNFSETDNSYVYEVELPGVKKEDIKIDVSDSELVIHGEKKTFEEDRRGQFYHMERSYGSFTRTLDLPSVADAGKIEAKMEHGVLRIEVAKSPDSGKKKQTVAIH